MTLNVDIPHFECLVRRVFLHDMDGRFGGFVRAVAFGVSSIEGRALGFHVLTEHGAVVSRLPIHALCSKPGAPYRMLDELELWDAMSHEVSVIEYSYLAGFAVSAFLKDKTEAPGRYRFTIDWHGSSVAEGAGETGWKCAHVLELDEGNYAALPNNRILWKDGAFIAGKLVRPDYKTMSRTWKAEDGSKWRTSDDDLAFYEVERVS